MTTAVKPPRMLSFSEVDWSKIIPGVESPFEFLTLKDIPVYYKVDREKGVVYHEYQAVLGYMQSEVAKWPIAVVAMPDMDTSEAVSIVSMPYAGFNEHIAFLRIDDDEMVELASYGFCHPSIFRSEGMQVPVLYETNGRSARERTRLGKKQSSLAKVGFDKALIVDRKGYADAKKSPWDKPDANKFAMVVEVRSDNLYMLSTDIEALRLEREQICEFVKYPYVHAEWMPGIYWMFQAAYALNEQHSILAKQVLGEMAPAEIDATVKKWIKERAPKNTFGYRSDRTAAKFVRKNLNRKRGGKNGKGNHRGEFDRNDLDSQHWLVEEAANYKFDFASGGLSFVLAIADWWYDLSAKNPSKTRESLCNRLKENGFDGAELGHLMHLIGGFADDRSKVNGTRPEKAR